MIFRAKAYPRVGLIGNPSDGYFGKTISFVFNNFRAEVILYESPELEILPSAKDQSCFNSIEELVKDVNQHGYYGGIRLLKATVKRFYEYCSEHYIDLHRKNFTIRYHSNIPHGVGLAGSSAIITACFRALMSFYGVSIPKYTQANLILSAEVEEHYALSERDLSELSATVEDLQPTHVVISDPIAIEAINRIKNGVGVVDVLSVSRSFPRFLDGERIGG